MNLLECVKYGEARFPSASIKERRYEAELIIAHILKIKRIDIYVKPEIIILPENEKKITAYFKRRIGGEPLQYILGTTEFRSVKLKVTKDVLIPRPETEQLVEEALKVIQTEKAVIVDVGTGSGAIGLSLAKELLDSYVLGVDTSKKALKVALKNKKINKLENIDFILGDLCNCIKNGKVDIITANLPYVTKEEYNKLERSVSAYEPARALLGGVDGLDFIKKLVGESIVKLNKKGWIILEIGYEQGEKVFELLKTADFEKISILKDFNNLDRIAVAQKP